MGMLLDAGIKETASGNVVEDGQHIVTADTAATTMVQFLNDLFDKFPLLNYQHQQPVCPPEPTRGNGVVHDTNANSSRPSKRTRIGNGGGGSQRTPVSMEGDGTQNVRPIYLDTFDGFLIKGTRIRSQTHSHTRNPTFGQNPASPCRVDTRMNHARSIVEDANPQIPELLSPLPTHQRIRHPLLSRAMILGGQSPTQKVMNIGRFMQQT